MSSATSIDRTVRAKSGRGGVQLKPDAIGPGAVTPTASKRQPVAEDAGLRPWHFFLLASLMAATAAVVLARQSTPEHLVLISLTIGAGGAAAAGFYRMLAPLATDDVSMFSEPLTERQRATLEREKTLVLRSIKELEFDRAMGKVSPKDFDEMSGRLRARALSLMKELDEGGSGYRELIERELKARLQASGGQVRLKPDTTGEVRLKADTTGDVRLKPDATEAVQADRFANGSVRLQPHNTCVCGTANDADAAFCKRCGVRLA